MCWILYIKRTKTKRHWEQFSDLMTKMAIWQFEILYHNTESDLDSTRDFCDVSPSITIFCLRFWCYIQMGMVINMQKIRRSLSIQKMGESKTWSLKVLESEVIKSECMVIKEASMTLELINNTMDGSYWEYSSWLDRILWRKLNKSIHYSLKWTNQGAYDYGWWSVEFGSISFVLQQRPAKCFLE